MQVKYPLTQMFTIEFRMAIIDVIYGNSAAPHKAFYSSQKIAEIKELVWC